MYYFYIQSGKYNKKKDKNKKLQAIWKLLLFSDDRIRYLKTQKNYTMISYFKTMCID